MTAVRERMEAFLAARKGERVLPEHEVKGFLRELGLPVPKGRYLARGEPLPASLPVPFPLAAKVVSRALPSKSDVGGVRLGLESRGELERAVSELLAIEGAEGVLVEESLPPGLEVIVGGVIDGQFGPVVMFGVGGVFVELFGDVAFALAPMTEAEARRLVGRVRGSRLLSGFRGRAPVATEPLIHILVTVSEVMATGLIEEIDLNPVALYPAGGVILDAKMLLLPGAAP